MLILTIAPGETIRIGDDVTIQVVTVNNTHVRVCIESNDDTPVQRQEGNGYVKLVGTVN